MGNHLSLRPEPGADNAVERRLALYLVLLREEFTLTTALSQTRPVGSYPTISTLPHPERMFGGILSVALVFPRLIVRGIPLFKGTPCSMQSGLSSAGKRTTYISARSEPPGRDCPRTHVPNYNIYRPAEYASSPQAFFIR